MLLSLGVHHGVAGVLERTGLTAGDAARGGARDVRRAPGRGGSPYYADLVAHHFEAPARRIEAGQRCLDFGCSSGRVVRVLKAAHAGRRNGTRAIRSRTPSRGPRSTSTA